MECLIKYVAEECETVRHEVFNNIDDFNSSYKRKPKAGRWTYKDKLKTKEDYLKYYGDKTCAVNMHRVTIVLEKDENKVSIKMYEYINFRPPGVHYFRKHQRLNYIT